MRFVLERVVYIVGKGRDASFLYLETFERNTTSGWLTVRFSQPESVLLSNLSNFGGNKKCQRMFFRMVGECGPRN